MLICVVCVLTVNTQTLWSTCSYSPAPQTQQEPLHSPSPSDQTWPPLQVSSRRTSAPTPSAGHLLSVQLSTFHITLRSSQRVFSQADVSWVIDGQFVSECDHNCVLDLQDVTLTRSGGRRLSWWSLIGSREMMWRQRDCTRRWSTCHAAFRPLSEWHVTVKNSIIIILLNILSKWGSNWLKGSSCCLWTHLPTINIILV